MNDQTKTYSQMWKAFLGRELGFSMTVVNNLCFSSDQFLRLLEVTEIGERIYFVDLTRLDNMMIWVGTTMPGYKIIRSVRDETERLEILRGFCPFFSGKTREGERGGQCGA